MLVLLVADEELPGRCTQLLRNFCLVKLKVLLWYCCDNTLGPWGH